MQVAVSKASASSPLEISESGDVLTVSDTEDGKQDDIRLTSYPGYVQIEGNVWTDLPAVHWLEPTVTGCFTVPLGLTFSAVNCPVTGLREINIATGPDTDEIEIMGSGPADFPDAKLTVDTGKGMDTIISRNGPIVGFESETYLLGQGEDKIVLANTGSCDDASREIAIEGGDGDDIVEGSDCVDTISGGDGVDQIWGMGDGDSIDGDAGADILVGDDGGTHLDGDDVISGGDGADQLFGDGGDDTIDGGGDGGRESGDAGDDVLLSGSGSDIFSGGDGSDTVSYGRRTADLSLSKDGQANDGAADEGDQIGSTIENLVSGAGNDTIKIRDDWPESADCGGGTGDTARIDSGDVLDVTSNCETVASGIFDPAFDIDASVDTDPDYEAPAAPAIDVFSLDRSTDPEETSTDFTSTDSTVAEAPTTPDPQSGPSAGATDTPTVPVVPTVSTTAASRCRISLVSSRARVSRRGVFKVKVKTSKPCSGSLSLRGRIKGAKISVSKKLKLTRPGTKTLTLRVTTKAYRKLRKTRKARFLTTLRSSEIAGTTSEAKHLTLIARR